MTRLVLRRIAMLPLLVWAVATVTFVVVHAAPGSYADTVGHARHSPEARRIVAERYGLDQPLPVQYLRWLGSVATGDLGVSFVYRRPVAEVVAAALPPTLLLAGTALVVELVLGVLLAVTAVRRPHGAVDRVLTALSLGVYGIPTFWLATMAVLVFAVGLGWLPPSHMASVGAERLPAAARLADLARHLVLPAGCLAVVGAAVTARYLRASLLDLRDARFVLAARARGLSEQRVLWVHTVRPALGPVVTLVGLSLPFLVSGSVVVESIFSWPGMGLALLQAATARDVPVVMAITVVGAVAVVLGNLASDLLYALVDPRARERP